MPKLHRLVILTVILALTATSIQAQDPTEYDCDQNYSYAYQQTNQVALWSAYATITVFVAAAIFMGIADGTSGSDCDSYGCPNGMGSMGSRGRSHRSNKSGRSNKCSKYSRSSYSHL